MQQRLDKSLKYMLSSISESILDTAIRHILPIAETAENPSVGRLFCAHLHLWISWICYFFSQLKYDLLDAFRQQPFDDSLTRFTERVLTRSRNDQTNQHGVEGSPNDHVQRHQVCWKASMSPCGLRHKPGDPLTH